MTPSSLVIAMSAAGVSTVLLSVALLLDGVGSVAVEETVAVPDSVPVADDSTSAVAV